MNSGDVVSGAAAGVIGGYVGTKVMTPVTTKLYELAPEEDKQREKAVSPGSPYKIGAQKVAGALGLRPSTEQLDLAAVLRLLAGRGKLPRRDCRVCRLLGDDREGGRSALASPASGA